MTVGIEPHGGVLVNRIVEGEEKRRMVQKVGQMERIVLNAREISDVEMIAIGGFSPLEGFIGRQDYESVLERKRLSSGPPWTIPITLSASSDQAGRLKEGDNVALTDETGEALAVLLLSEKYTYNKEQEAVKVYSTSDRAHPGVDALCRMGDVLLGGRISVIQRPRHDDFLAYRLDPIQTREIFHRRGWRRTVAFQTRNPVHRAHEYLQKCALEAVDGLFLHPLVGETKSDDIPADLRMRSYEVALQEYYPKDRVLMAVNPAAMRYAGPREAIFHAIVRKNYGCTHFIVGRDHAGVGNYYGPFDAHAIFDEFDPAELKITPMFFDNAFYCRRCGGMASYKTCPHDRSYHMTLSGTKVREMLRAGQILPPEFTRPEVAHVLMEGLAGGEA